MPRTKFKYILKDASSREIPEGTLKKIRKRILPAKSVMKRKVQQPVVEDAEFCDGQELGDEPDVSQHHHTVIN